MLMVTDLYSSSSSNKLPLSTRSGASKATNKAGIMRRNTAGRKAVKVIEWYFYPEYANKKLFKYNSVNQDLKKVTGKHYEVLS